MTFQSPDESRTLRLAARLARRAKPGMLICLSGPLGSGKTTFVRGFLRGLGFAGAVPSPTFALIHEYPRLRPKVYHADFYRLGARDLPALGFAEYLEDPEAVVLLEWPEAAEPFLPADRIEVSLSHVRGGGRELRLRARGPRSRALVAGLR